MTSAEIVGLCRVPFIGKDIQYKQVILALPVKAPENQHEVIRTHQWVKTPGGWQVALGDNLGPFPIRFLEKNKKYLEWMLNSYISLNLICLAFTPPKM
jgi:hypothetical protein